MAKFIGLKQKQGPYELRDEKTGEVTKKGNYHNFYLHYTDEAETGGESLVDTTKHETFIGKIKAENVSGVFGFQITTSEQLNDWYLKDIDVLFNRKGDVVSVRLAEDKAKK